MITACNPALKLRDPNLHARLTRTLQAALSALGILLAKYQIIQLDKFSNRKEFEVCIRIEVAKQNSCVLAEGAFRCRKHVDNEGKFCQGLYCLTAVNINAQMAPRLSKACVHFVEHLLRTGVPTAKILAEHQQHIADVMCSSSTADLLCWTRDMHLTSADIRNIQGGLRKEGQIYHHSDAQAIRQWVQRFPESVLHFVEHSRASDQTYVLVGTPWMLETLSEYGHKRTICLDTTHGMNS
ncbi:hypothetical protein R1sor_020027 [Riccia sorocarpa]|uniref:Uncharacterized protein n=1 Tax=Riccia sorocarpa TaxID=122646 RepID=A0ABD3II00_9MARC